MMGDRQNNTNDTKQEFSLVYPSKFPNMLTVPAVINPGQFGPIQLVAQPITNGMRSKSTVQPYGNYHGPYIIDNKLFVENSTLMVAKPQATTANSVPQGVRPPQIVTSKGSPMLTTKQLQQQTQHLQASKAILLNKQPNAQNIVNGSNGSTAHVRKTDGISRDGVTPMQSTLSAGATVARPVMPTNQNLLDYRGQPMLQGRVLNKNITIQQPGQPAMNGQPVNFYTNCILSNGQFLPFPQTGLQPITQIRNVNMNMNDAMNNNLQQKYPGSYVHLCGTPAPTTQSSANTFQMVTSTASMVTQPQIVTSSTSSVNQQNLNEMYQRPLILHRKRQNGTLVQNQMQRSPPLAAPLMSPSTSSSQIAETVSTAALNGGPPPVKQAKLNASIEPVHIKVAHGVAGGLKFSTDHSVSQQVSDLRGQTVIRSPNRCNRRKQNLEVPFPLTVSSPSSQLRIPVDKLVDEVSTDEAEECEDEQPKELKKEEPKIEISEPIPQVQSLPLPKYRKGSKPSTPNISNHNTHNVSSNEPVIKMPRAIRTCKTRQISTSTTSSDHKPELCLQARMHVNGYDYKAKRGPTLHFLNDVHVNRSYLFDGLLPLKEVKEQAKCCVTKLNLLKKELTACQATQHKLQSEFSKRKQKICASGRLQELYSNIELRNRLLVSDLNESNAASSRLVLHYNKLEEKPDRRDVPLLRRLLKKAKLKN